MHKKEDIGNRLLSFQFWQTKSKKHLLWLKPMDKWTLMLKV